MLIVFKSARNGASFILVTQAKVNVKWRKEKGRRTFAFSVLFAIRFDCRIVCLDCLRNHDVHYDNQNDENERQDGGYHAQLSVSVLALALAKEGLCGTGNGSGQTLILTRLEQNASNENESEHANNDTQCDFHRKFPP